MPTITIDNWIEADRRVFQHKKDRIQAALHGSTGIVNGVTEENKEDIFYMLLFCLCVPQNKAIKAEEAVEVLRKKDFYNVPLTESEICDILKGRVRFCYTKSKRLIKARDKFCNSDLWEALKSYFRDYGSHNKTYDAGILHSAREYLKQNVDGLGLKLSSYFLRNIGMTGLSILDSHVMDGLCKRGVIENSKDDI